MTTIYVPRLIESVEQAEALPEGTVAVRDGALPRLLVVDTTGPHWLTGTRAPGYVHPIDMVGWTALVPVEAEEERLLFPTLYLFERKLNEVHRKTRLVTPWEEM